MGFGTEKEVDILNMRYRKILRSMVFGNFTASLQDSVVGSEEESERGVLPFCG